MIETVAFTVETRAGRERLGEAKGGNLICGGKAGITDLQVLVGRSNRCHRGLISIREASTILDAMAGTIGSVLRRISRNAREYLV